MNVLLPIGSVVLLKGGEKRLMICGRIQTDVATGVTYDYSACLYPEGMISSKEMFMFNNEDIMKLFFIGFQDEEGLAFKKFLEEQLAKKTESESSENK